MFAKADGTIVDGNDEFLRIVGYSREELEAGTISWMKITPPGWTETDHEISLRVRNTGSAPAFEKEYIRKDGSRVPVMIGIAALPESERDRGAMCFVVDLSVRKQAERERDRLMTERVAMLESAGDGIYGMDVNGPMHLHKSRRGPHARIRARRMSRAQHPRTGSRKYPDGSAYPRGLSGISRGRAPGKRPCRKEVVWRKDGTSSSGGYRLTRSSRRPHGGYRGVIQGHQRAKKGGNSLACQRGALPSARSPTPRPECSSSNLQGRFLEVNRAFCHERHAATGTGRPGVMRRSRIRGSGRERLLAGKLLRRRLLICTVKRYVRKDGSLLWARRASRWRAIGGKPCEVVRIAEDITERLRTETELRRSEERYRSIVENTHEGICMCDAERGITYCNPLLEMLGYEESNAELDCSEIHLDEDAEDDRRRFEQRKLGISESYETRLTARMDRFFGSAVRPAPSRTSTEILAARLCMFTDIGTEALGGAASPSPENGSSGQAGWGHRTRL